MSTLEAVDKKLAALTHKRDQAVAGWRDEAAALTAERDRLVAEQEATALVDGLSETQRQVLAVELAKSGG